MITRLLSPVAICVMLTLGGCNVATTPAGPEQHESHSVDLDKSELVRVDLNMPVGVLDIHGGAAKLMEGDFTYNVEAWKPDLRYTAGELTLEQHGSSTSFGQAKNNWDLRFNDGVPLDIKAKLGAGEGRLNLGSMMLRSVGIEIGAGTLRLDLRGSPKQDYPVRIQGGVGETTVYLPKDVGISATATKGIGGVSVTGLHKNGDTYQNDAYERAGVKIRLDIQAGVGSIKLVAE